MTPICCGQDARWVVNGRDLQYWYCGECKREVDEVKPWTVSMDGLVPPPPPAFPKSCSNGFHQWRPIYNGLGFFECTGCGAVQSPTPGATTPTACATGAHSWNVNTDSCNDCGANYLDVMTSALSKGIP